MYRDYEHTIVITNRGLVQGDFFEQMERVISLHPHAVILREKDLTDEAYEKLAKRLLELCQREGVSCFLHSRVSVARHLDCRKIHLSIPALAAMEPSVRGNLRAYFQEISVSCHSMEDMEIAVKYGATQIILGTIFETECKKGLKGQRSCICPGDLPCLSGSGICDRRHQYGTPAACDRGGSSRRLHDVWIYAIYTNGRVNCACKKIVKRLTKSVKDAIMVTLKAISL